MCPEHFIKCYKQQKCTYNKFIICLPKNLIAIFIKWSSSLSFQFTLLFIPSCNFLSSYFCFTLSGGSSHCLNFKTFRDSAPLRFPKYGVNVTRKIMNAVLQQNGRPPVTDFYLLFFFFWRIYVKSFLFVKIRVSSE